MLQSGIKAPADDGYGVASKWHRSPGEPVALFTGSTRTFLRHKAVTFVCQPEPSVSPLTTALALNGCQEQ